MTPTTQEKLEDIRRACIEANPEIVELKFGCRVNGKATHLPQTSGEIVQSVDEDYWVIHSDGFGTFGHFHTTELEIIGRDIRLSDVLLAVRQASVRNGVQWDDYVKRVMVIIGKNVDQGWNLLHDDLDWHAKNRPEVIDFLHLLLKHPLLPPDTQ